MLAIEFFSDSAQKCQKIGMLVDWGLTSHQQLRSYGDGTSENWHVLFRFATWPIGQTKNILLHTHYRKGLLSLELNSAYKKNVKHGCQLGLWYQSGNILVLIS